MTGSQSLLGMMDGTGLNCQNLSGTQCDMTQNADGTCNAPGTRTVRIWPFAGLELFI